MILKNTSCYPTAEVRKIIKFALADLDTIGLAVHVKNSKFAYAGTAHSVIPRMSKSYGVATQLIVVRIGKPEKFPTDNVGCREHAYGGKGSPVIVHTNWQEAMIAVTAHEGHHIKQFRHKWPASEVECEKVAARRLAQWRAKQLGEGIID